MATGTGKGRGAEARVGALYEALEHYLTGPALFDATAVTQADCLEIARGPLSSDLAVALLARRPTQRLACHSYRSLTEERAVLVPVFLSAPWYVESHAGHLREKASDTCDYGELMRYSCNSGSAIGVTAAEALLHALNEVIERDAFSLLLARSFLGEGATRLTVIDPATLPSGLARAFTACERLTNSQVHLLDITTNLGVPTMLAYSPPTAGRPHRRGVGTSLSSTHAAWRALTEFLQISLGEESSPPSRSPHAHLTGLVAYPALFACGRFDLTDHLRTAWTMPFIPTGSASGPPHVQLQEVIATLTSHRYPLYHRTVAILPGEITAVHAIVPGLERFMIVTEGNLVIPGPRGRAAARESQNLTVARRDPAQPQH
ncbi:YcaO-like family protein [Nonomuraea sp. NPDC048901]|uniref:YcaO-like family protein n=1 Tax=Nonomuraea sp. NPDC048901 TaxID=3155627 RepID=UPI0033E60072